MARPAGVRVRCRPCTRRPCCSTGILCGACSTACQTLRHVPVRQTLLWSRSPAHGQGRILHRVDSQTPSRSRGTSGGSLACFCEPRLLSVWKAARRFKGVDDQVASAKGPKGFDGISHLDWGVLQELDHFTSRLFRRGISLLTTVRLGASSRPGPPAPPVTIDDPLPYCLFGAYAPIPLDSIRQDAHGVKRRETTPTKTGGPPYMPVFVLETPFLTVKSIPSGRGIQCGGWDLNPRTPKGRDAPSEAWLRS